MAFDLNGKDDIVKALNSTSTKNNKKVRKTVTSKTNTKKGNFENPKDLIPNREDRQIEKKKVYTITMQPSTKQKAIEVMKKHGYNNRQFSTFLQDLVEAVYQLDQN